MKPTLSQTPSLRMIPEKPERSFELNDKGLQEIYRQLDDEYSGCQNVNFGWIYEGLDLQVAGPVWTGRYGIWMHFLTATDFDSNEYPVTFDAREYNLCYRDSSSYQV